MLKLTEKEYTGLFFIVLLIEISPVDGFTKPCNASLQTVSVVSECPTNQSSYEAAARRKHCLSVPGQGSGCESFQYHCVLNEESNGLVEVCAPSLNIIDHVCAMFSSEEKSIKRINDLSCENSTGFTPCPYSYNSTSSFLYQQCFIIADRFITTEATQSSKNVPTISLKDSETSSNQAWIAGVIVSVIAAVIGLIITVVCLVRRHKNKGQQNVGIVRENRADDPEIKINMEEVHAVRPPDNDNDMRPNVPPDSPALENEPLLPNDGQQNGGIVRKNRADAPETEMDEVHDIVPPGNDNDMLPNVQPNLPPLGIEPPLPNNDDAGNGNHVEAKIDIITDRIAKKAMLEFSTDILIESLKNPDETWTTEKIISHFENHINQFKETNETDLLMKFIERIRQDPEIKNTLVRCGERMFHLISSIKEKYKATKILINDGCVCFIVYFAEDQDLQKFVIDLKGGNNDFAKDVSSILLNRTFLSAFDINAEDVSWKATGIKVYKGSEEWQQVELVNPLTGTHRDTYADDSATEAPVEKPTAQTEISVEETKPSTSDIEEETIPKFINDPSTAVDPAFDDAKSDFIGLYSPLEQVIVTKEKSEDERVMDAFQSKKNQYPAYKRVKTRILSFDGCEDDMEKRREEFARYGFYYEGFDKKTTCFHCGSTKSDWKDSDDILEAHLTLNGDCEYLNYVQSHITNT